jgi:hypothetical protein
VKKSRAAVRLVLRSVRALDRTIGRALGPRRVLVEARTPMNLAVLRPVFEPLLRDPRVDVRFTGVEREDLAQAFRELGIADRVLPRREVRWRRFDLYMNADPWEAAPLARAGRQLNFFHGVAGKYNLDCPTELPLAFDRYDRVAFPNEGRRNNYVAAGIVSADRAALIGFPKADALVADTVGPRAAAGALGLDASRPTAIFSPTFSPASALNAAGMAIVRGLLDTGCNVIAKLHDRSLDSDPRYNGGVNWRERLAPLAGPHFLLAGSGDSTPYVLASEVMVTDHSSIGFEFCALDRPLIVFDAPGLIEAARINPDKVALLRAAATVVSDRASLQDAVREALASPAARALERRRAAAGVFYRPGGATARALRLVYDMLDLAPAGHQVASAEPRPRDAFSTAK